MRRGSRLFSSFGAVIITVGMSVLPAIVAADQEFTVNVQRHDPYKNYRFRVKWDGQYVVGVFNVSGLQRSIEVIEHRDGGDAGVRRSPGRTLIHPIVLQRGRTHAGEFERWANLVSPGNGAIALKEYRKDIEIDFFNEADQLVLSFKAYRCWPSAYTALGPLDAKNTAVAVESLTLQCEAWERDQSVAEPKEP